MSHTHDNKNKKKTDNCVKQTTITGTTTGETDDNNKQKNPMDDTHQKRRHEQDKHITVDVCYFLCISKQQK